MQEYENLEIAVSFDPELFMMTSQERRIAGTVFEKMQNLWQEWLPHCTALHLKTEEHGYLLVWLDDFVEQAVDSIWAESPASGFQANALAQTICMAVVHDFLPQILDAGCAPSPKPDPVLKKMLKKAGVPYTGSGSALAKRYAVLTPMPFRGGCEICAMRENCPKGMGTGEDAFSITLPGFEKE